MYTYTLQFAAPSHARTQRSLEELKLPHIGIELKMYIISKDKLKTGKKDYIKEKVFVQREWEEASPYSSPTPLPLLYLLHLAYHNIACISKDLWINNANNNDFIISNRNNNILRYLKTIMRMH